jgi:signal transduction histidine kinase
VYAEASADSVEVYVRDRGVGFDPESAAGNRHGIRDSILGRMARHGGSAEVRSTPGQGTEVRLHLPRRKGDSDG